MPDRNAELLAAQRAAKARQYDEGLARWHEQHPDENVAHLTAQAIAACTLCDAEGYRRPELTVVCDHVDRTHIGQAQKAHIRKMLAKGER